MPFRSSGGLGFGAVCRGCVGLGIAAGLDRLANCGVVYRRTELVLGSLALGSPVEASDA